MNLNLGKEVSVLGKSVPIALIALAVLAIPATAATLEYFGTVTTEADVSQAALVNGGDELTSSYDVTGGATVTSINTLLTQTPVPVELDFVPSYSPDGQGITTTYQLVTTTFAKGDGNSATWSSESLSGDESVEMKIEKDAMSWDTGTGVLVPISKKIGDITLGNLRFEVKGFNESTPAPYVQLMVDLDTTNSSSQWAQVIQKKPNVEDTDGWQTVSPETSVASWYLQKSDGSFIRNSTGDAMLPGSDVQSLLGSYANHGVKGVKVQYSWCPVKNESNWGCVYDVDNNTIYVDEVSDSINTYNLESDNLQSIDVTGETFTMPPYPDEKFDFQITNEFGVDIQPDNYTITTEVQPVV